MSIALIGLGTNLGDRPTNLQSALDQLAHHPSCELLARSSIYQSAPMGPQDQPDFLNMACQLQTSLQPLQLLELCKQLEADLGRLPGERWGPRLIDLDILLFGEQFLQQDELSIPHPGLSERAFVLLPLTELVPGWRVPGCNKTVQQLAASCSSDDISRWKPGTES